MIWLWPVAAALLAGGRAELGAEARLDAQVARVLARSSTREQVFAQSKGQGQPPEELQAYSDRNLGVAEDSRVRVSGDEWKAMHDKVLSFPGRYALNPSLATVSDDLAKDLGGEKRPFTIQGKPAWNIQAEIPGATTGLVVVGAHYDSLPVGEVAPGAEDNASGVAALLALHEAVVKALNGRKPARTIRFVLFDGEEEGLLGSKAYVAALLKEPNFDRDHFEAIILDEVSFSRDHFEKGGGEKRLILETRGQQKGTDRIIDTLASGARSLAELSKAAGEDPTPPTFEVNYAGFGSDHIPFLDAGLPAVLIIERDNMWFADHYGHSTKDTPEKTWPALGAAVATLVADAVLALASAPTS